MSVATGALHEPISRHGPGWLAEWEDAEGVSDSGAALYLPFILDKLQPRTLIVERPADEVLKSFARYVGDHPIDWSKVHALLAASLRGLNVESPLVRRVAYRDLADLATVEAAIDWLGCERPRNLAQLCHMVIQSDLAYNLSLLAARAA